jgi:hypothetical protein
MDNHGVQILLRALDTARSSSSSGCAKSDSGGI